MIMNRLHVWLLFIAFVIAVDKALEGHPGHDHGNADAVKNPATPTVRQWDIQGLKKTLTASFVMARDGFVQVRRDDDTLVDVPWEKLSREDQEFIEYRLASIQVDAIAPLLLAQLQRRENAAAQEPIPIIARHFDPYVQLKAIQTRWDEKFLYVESQGIPAHSMMVGITAWQQQVPIPQKYVGKNAWQIPLQPVEAKTPVLAKNRFLRGAIALAVNGIPIFNPLNNRGDDAFLFGELDEYGGHCGRADDYHYHLAPVHLEKIVGKGNPIAYALDGYPIFGFQDPQDRESAPLDPLNGHKDAEGRYHYHATKAYPYLNGGFHGVVIEKDGQVDPQPRAEPLRPAQSPLRNAKITGFEETKPGSYQLTYDLNGKKGTVRYSVAENGSATFEFVDPAGRKTTETYSSRRRGGEHPPRRSDDNVAPPGERSPRTNDRPQQRQSSGRESNADSQKLEVSSTSVNSSGRLSIDCTCDGKRESPAISWKGAPTGTKFFAISLWHTAPDQEKSYWLIYNIPASNSGFAQNAKPDGNVGMNDRRRAEYDPMCSKGPGLKTYHLTVFALSKKIDLPPDQVTRARLLETIKGGVLAEGTLDLQYERKSP